MHSAAYVLNPRSLHRAEDLMDDEELTLDTRVVVKKMILGANVKERRATVMTEVIKFRMQEGWSAGEDAASYADMMLPYRW
eukprot:SAG11_NODE_1567_length_4672_cov_13.208834_6_plen_81_part_00